MTSQPDRVERILTLLADPNGQIQHVEALSDLGEVVGCILAFVPSANRVAVVDAFKMHAMTVASLRQ